MNTLELNRTFLKRPLNGLLILLAISLPFELFAWLSSPQDRQLAVGWARGAPNHLLRWIFGFYLPETLTAAILLVLVESYHRLLGIEELTLNSKSVILYELRFLPLFLIAYFVFIPFTLHTRFLLREFPLFSMQRYGSKYQDVLYTYYGWRLYTPFVTVMGYVMLNVSLIVDFMQNLKNSAPGEESAPAPSLLGIPHAYAETIAARTPTGDTVLSVGDCYLFETDRGAYYAETDQGRLVITKSLAELEDELDPARFFRGNRQYLLNLDHFESHAYWDKGKYVLRSRKLPGRDLIMPRARLHSLREALERNRSAAPPSPAFTQHFVSEPEAP